MKKAILVVLVAAIAYLGARAADEIAAQMSLSVRNGLFSDDMKASFTTDQTTVGVETITMAVDNTTNQVVFAQLTAPRWCMIRNISSNTGLTNEVAIGVVGSNTFWEVNRIAADEAVVHKLGDSVTLYLQSIMDATNNIVVSSWEE